MKEPIYSISLEKVFLEIQTQKLVAKKILEYLEKFMIAGISAPVYKNYFYQTTEDVLIIVKFMDGFSYMELSFYSNKIKNSKEYIEIQNIIKSQK